MFPNDEQPGSCRRMQFGVRLIGSRTATGGSPFVVVGLPSKQTAVELATSEITIRVHRGQIMRKMQAQSLAELVRMADKLGIR